jgi:putative transposase
MARIARMTLPGCPHHIIQRGYRRLRTFFGDHDYQACLNLVAEWGSRLLHLALDAPRAAD